MPSSEICRTVRIWQIPASASKLTVFSRRYIRQRTVWHLAVLQLQIGWEGPPLRTILQLFSKLARRTIPGTGKKPIFSVVSRITWKNSFCAGERFYFLGMIKSPSFRVIKITSICDKWSLKTHNFHQMSIILKLDIKQIVRATCGYMQLHAAKWISNRKP